MTEPSPCTKRKFTSKGAARRAHGKARFRIRCYWCDRCRAYHVTNSDKGYGPR